MSTLHIQAEYLDKKLRTAHHHAFFRFVIVFGFQSYIQLTLKLHPKHPEILNRGKTSCSHTMS